MLILSIDTVSIVYVTASPPGVQRQTNINDIESWRFMLKPLIHTLACIYIFILPRG